MACIIKDPGRRWDGPIIPFTIDPNLSNPQRVMQAIAAWESVTGVRFVAHDRQGDHVHIQHGQHACHSDIGHKGGTQFVNLRADCPVETVVHELGHTLGLIHEHQRPDRDDFVEVHLENVQPGEEGNFKRLNVNDVIVTPDYDFRSIMHYSSTTFSKDPSNSAVLTIDGHGQVLDGSTSPTVLDAQLVNDSYRSFRGVVRRSDSGEDAAGAVGEIAMASIFPDFITAVQSGAGNLKLILWGMDSFGGILRRADSGDQAGEASNIAVAAGAGKIVTAVRDGSGDLKLILWNLQNNHIQRVGEGTVEPDSASLIQILNLTPTDESPVFLTAHRSAGSPGHLKLITWKPNPDDGSFTRLGDNQAGEVFEISLALLQPPNTSPVPTALVATSVQAANGHAKAIAWQVTIPDGTITRSGDSDRHIPIGDATEIASAVQSASALDPTEHLVVSCRSGSGNLKLIVLEISDTGDDVNRVADSGNQAGEISLNALVARPGGVLSAVRDGADDLKLINWRIEPDGSIDRAGDSSDQAGAVGIISLGTSSHPNASLATAVQRGNGDLALISWDDNPVQGEI